jgi:hypothetical protein
MGKQFRAPGPAGSMCAGERRHRQIPHLGNGTGPARPPARRPARVGVVWSRCPKGWQAWTCIGCPWPRASPWESCAAAARSSKRSRHITSTAGRAIYTTHPSRSSLAAKFSPSKWHPSGATSKAIVASSAKAPWDSPGWATRAFSATRSAAGTAESSLISPKRSPALGTSTPTGGAPCRVCTRHMRFQARRFGAHIRSVMHVLGPVRHWVLADSCMPRRSGPFNGPPVRQGPVLLQNVSRGAGAKRARRWPR